MANESPLKPDDLGDLPLLEPEDGPFSAYANIVNLNWTLTDVCLRFGELVQVPNEDNPVWAAMEKVILERAYITIPWWQAKVLCTMLTEVVRGYESVNGELKQPILAEAPKAQP